MSAEGTAHAPTAGEYIVHHLHHPQSGHQKAVVDFSRDQPRLGVLVGADRRWAAGCCGWPRAKASSGRAGPLPRPPSRCWSRWSTQAKGIVYNATSRVGRAAGAHRVRLIFLLNAMDLLPVDLLLPWIWQRLQATTKPICASCRLPTCRSPWACRWAC